MVRSYNKIENNPVNEVYNTEYKIVILTISMKVRKN